MWRHFYELPSEESMIGELGQAIEALEPGGRTTKDGITRAEECLALVEQLQVRVVEGAWTPVSSLWKTLPPMKHARCNFALVPLPGGGVFAAGGWDGPQRGWDKGGHMVVSAEVLYPGEAGWHGIADLPTARHGCTGCLLQDGRVMVVGGSDEKLGPLRVVESWDPATGKWRRMTSTFGEHANAGVCTLPDGRVLVCGGYGGGRQAEVYDLAEDSWTLLADMNHPRTGGRFGFTAVSIGGGDVMVVGGKGLTSCEKLNTIDNSKELFAAVSNADAKEAAIPVKEEAAAQAAALVLEAVDAVPKLKEEEKAAAAAAEEAVDTYADDALEKGDARAAARQARIDGQELIVTRKQEAQKALAAAQTAVLVAETARRDAEALRKVWEDLASLRSSRFEAAVCFIDGRVVAIGGENMKHQILGSAEVYHPGSDTWRPLPEGHMPPLPDGRSGAKTDLRCAVVHGGFWGGATVVPDEQFIPFEDTRPTTGGGFHKANKLVAQYERGLFETQAERDTYAWNPEEEEKLTVLSRRYPGGTDPEWKEIAKQLGTGRSMDAVKAHHAMVFAASGGRSSPKRRGKKTPKKGNRKAYAIRRQFTAEVKVVYTTHGID